MHGNEILILRSGYSNFARLILVFDMLAGRLEIFPMLVLFMPDAWRRF